LAACAHCGGGYAPNLIPGRQLTSSAFSPAVVELLSLVALRSLGTTSISLSSTRHHFHKLVKDISCIPSCLPNRRLQKQTSLADYPQPGSRRLPHHREGASEPGFRHFYMCSIGGLGDEIRRPCAGVPGQLEGAWVGILVSGLRSGSTKVQCHRTLELAIILSNQCLTIRTAPPQSPRKKDLC
jgi:hypothetical protein